MNEGVHPKALRRHILLLLYERYQADPLAMAGPEVFLHEHGYGREELIPNIHYLHDRRLVELMIGYHPPMFSCARITADGIDLVENRFLFDLRFPPEHLLEQTSGADLPTLMERLVQEAEFMPLDGEQRLALLRDVQYLREEALRAGERMRRPVITSVIGWIEEAVRGAGSELPTLPALRSCLETCLGREKEPSDAPSGNS